MKKNMFTKCTIIAMLFVGPALIFQGCSDHEEDPEPKVSIKLGKDLSDANILTDSQGKALYFFEKDVAGNSNCSGGCAGVWPAFYDANLITGTGLDFSIFGTVTRADGKKQNTYKGWPLYYFAQDVVPGETKGDNKNGFFSAKPDYTVFFGNTGSGRYLVDSKGNTLYTFENDTDDVSNCNGGCAGVWPSFFIEPPLVPSALSPADFYKLARTDSKPQVSFKKHPLYFFSKDLVRGDTNGNAANPKFKTVSLN
jgi:predicted lipoprotein with Yx(FWY)xxD motif